MAVQPNPGIWASSPGVGRAGGGSCSVVGASLHSRVRFSGLNAQLLLLTNGPGTESLCALFPPLFP